MIDDRRAFFRAAAAALTAAQLDAHAASSATPVEVPHDMSQFPSNWTGHEQIGMLLYPGMTALDLVGPQYMFAGLMGATVHLIASSMEPVESDTRLAILPTTVLDRAPADLDILFVPGGGTGTLAVMRDRRLVDFVADRGSRSRWVTSVCTGSLVLGAAGLLDGYRATSHWITRPLLARVGAIPTEARVVRDRNRVTGAGVSAGLDLGLYMAGLLRDTTYAQTLQLLAEYAPEPPYRAGTPGSAPPRVKAILVDMFKEFIPQAKSALDGAHAPKTH